MLRAVLGHQSVYGHPGAGRSAGLILRDCVTRGERGADVDIHALALELKGGELAGLRMFARYLDGDVLGHFTPPVWLQNGGSQRQPLGRC